MECLQTQQICRKRYETLKGVILKFQRTKTDKNKGGKKKWKRKRRELRDVHLAEKKAENGEGAEKDDEYIGKQRDKA